MLYGLWGDTLKVCSIFLKLKEVGVLQPPVCTLKPLWSPRIVMLPFDKETAHSCIHRAVCCISCAFTAWSCWTSHFPVPVRFCSDFHRQWLCFLLERTCYSSYVLTTAIISSLWVSGIKIMGKKKKQINQQQYLLYCFPAYISVKKTICLEWDTLPVQKRGRVWLLLLPGSSVIEIGKRYWVVGFFGFFPDLRWWVCFVKDKMTPLSCLSAGGETKSSEISKKPEMKLSRYW